MATRVDVGSRVEPHGVGAGVTAAGADGQPVQVVGPAGLVGGDLAGWEVAVGKAEQGAAVLWDQLDLDHAGAGRQRAALNLPAPGKHDPPGRVDLQEPPHGPPVAADIHAEHAAWARVELGLQSLPLQPASRVGEEPEDGLWGGLDAALDHEGSAGWRHRGRSGSAASASSASRSSWLVHICSSSTEKGSSAWRLAR